MQPQRSTVPLFHVFGKVIFEATGSLPGTMDDSLEGAVVWFWFCLDLVDSALQNLSASHPSHPG